MSRRQSDIFALFHGMPVDEVPGSGNILSVFHQSYWQQLLLGDRFCAGKYRHKVDIERRCITHTRAHTHNTNTCKTMSENAIANAFDIWKLTILPPKNVFLYWRKNIKCTMYMFIFTRSQIKSGKGGVLSLLTLKIKV